MLKITIIILCFKSILFPARNIAIKRAFRVTSTALLWPLKTKQYAFSTVFNLCHKLPEKIYNYTSIDSVYPPPLIVYVVEISLRTSLLMHEAIKAIHAVTTLTRQFGLDLV